MKRLAVEKILKALAGEALGRMAPRTHDVIFLTRAAGVSVPQEHMDFIGRINAAIPKERRTLQGPACSYGDQG